jgi:plasmid maintenance system antidote protein VapI
MIKNFKDRATENIFNGIASKAARKFFGITPDFWMNLQLRWDLYFAKESEADELNNIKLFSKLKPSLASSIARISSG